MAVTVKVEWKGGNLDALLKRISDMTGSVDVGLLGAKGSARRGDGTVAGIALVNEFGTTDGRIPARPAMRRAARLKDFASGFEGGLRKVVAGAPAEVGLRDGGDQALSVMERSYATAKGWARGNAASTIKKKGFDLPLLETGKTQDSLDYRVNKGG